MPRMIERDLFWHSYDKTYNWYRDGQAQQSEWPHCLEEIPSFRFRGKNGTLTARKEERERGGCYWYAYLKYQQKSHKLYLGKTEEITIEKLEETAGQLRTLTGR